jgi:hypothetical protein
MDPELYNKCEQEYEQSCINRQHDSDKRQRRWEILEQQAAKHLNPTANTNHVDKAQGTEMQIDSAAAVNIPERIPEEPEPDEQEHNDGKMSVDAGTAGSPSLSQRHPG